LKLKYDEPLSSFASKFILCRYIAGYYQATCRDLAKVAQLFLNKGEAVQVDPIKPELKMRLVSALKSKA
jgi:hypothetical protein